MIRPHLPAKLPLKLDHNLFSRELTRAGYALGLLEGSQKNLHNPTLLVSPLTAKEAEVSSKIEGTQSNASDIFVYEASGESRHVDTAQVANYRRAILAAQGEMQEGGEITAHLIKSLHSILLSNVRHRGTIGEFRKGQVWIAEKAGDPIEKALYIPPGALHVQGYIDNLLDYLLSDEEDALIQAGVAHYQFEAVHPFDDGNGRMGRLLIPLLLYQKRRVTSPIIYLSGYFESHRDEYIKTLHEVDSTGKCEPWLRFFFIAVVEQAAQTQKLIAGINGLHDRLKKSFGLIKSPYAGRLLDYIFTRPVFTIPDMVASLGASRITCIRLLDELLKTKTVFKMKSRRGHAILYSFDPLLTLLDQS